MRKVPRWLKNRERNLRHRISQSMRDTGYANGKARRLQRKLDRLERVGRALRGI